MENDIEVSSSSVGSKGGKKTFSSVWKTFERITEGGVKKAKCKKCGKIYKCGTSNLGRHSKDFCPFRDSSNVEFQSEEFDQNVFREKVAKAMLKHNYPFEFVEHEGIRDVFSYLNPKVEHISRNTLEGDILKIYEVEKEKLKGILGSISSRICLTAGLWSSLVSDEYMTVTAHYVDNNWVLQKRVLVFRHLPPLDDGQNVGEKLLDFIKEWGIERKVFTITLNDAKYNDGVVDLLRNHLSFLHVRCGAEIFNLVIQAGLKTIDTCIEKIRDSVKYVRGSESRMTKFVDCVKQLGLKTSKKLRQDMPIRWNSTYLMLDSAILYSRAFCELKLVDSNYKWCPSTEEWSRVEKILKILRPFHDITELFSGNQYPTSNLYFTKVWSIQMLIQEEMTDTDPGISRMVRDIKPKFDKYWESYSTLLKFGVVLDPRYKLKLVEFCYQKLDPLTSTEKCRGLEDQIQLLFEEYLQLSLVSRSSSGGCDDDMEDGMDEEYYAYLSRSQMKLYLEEPTLGRKQFPNLDVLDYWKGNSTRYPELALMARDILSIPITTFASESAFSHGGRIIGKFCSSVLPKNAEAILCGRDWLEAYDTENEEEEEELSMDIEKLVSELGGTSITSN